MFVMLFLFSTYFMYVLSEDSEMRVGYMGYMTNNKSSLKMHDYEYNNWNFFNAFYMGNWKKV